MKKFFTAMLLTLSVFMLCGCIYVGPGDYSGSYKVTVANKSSYDIADWYIEDYYSGEVYEGKYRDIYAGESSTIGGFTYNQKVIVCYRFEGKRDYLYSEPERIKSNKRYIIGYYSSDDYWE